MFNRVFPAALVLSICASGVHASSVTYDGITFPEGDISFADVLVSLNFGSSAPTDPDFLDGDKALGPPDYTGGGSGTGAVSLGDGGTIVLQFTDNALTGSGNSDMDLHIFEVGPDVEDTFVDISKDGSVWYSVGKVFGATSSIDIDAFGWGISDLFYFVRLTDDTNEGQQVGATVGADIDAVGAISTRFVPPTSEVPLPAAGWLMLAGLGGLAALRRKRAR